MSPTVKARTAPRRPLQAGIACAILSLGVTALARPADPPAAAAAEQAAPTPTEDLKTDPAALQKALAAGRFDKLSEAELRVQLEGMNPTVLIDAAMILLKKRPEYQTLLTKNERLRGELQSQPDVIQIHYKRQPLSIIAEYVGGDHVGRQVLYRDDLKPGQITIAEPAILGYLGLDLSVDSSLTKRSTNHSILEMGLEFPLTMMRKDVVALTAAGKTPNLAEGRLVTAFGRKCWEISVSTDGPPNYYAARSKLRFDISTALVTDMEISDKDGLLLESFTYQNIKFGANPPGTFDEDNEKYHF